MMRHIEFCFVCIVSRIGVVGNGGPVFAMVVSRWVNNERSCR